MTTEQQPYQLRPVDHAAMLKTAPPKNRQYIQQEIINAKQHAAVMEARRQREIQQQILAQQQELIGLGRTVYSHVATSADVADGTSIAATTASGDGGADASSSATPYVPLYNIGAIGRRRRIVGQGMTFEEKVLAKKILKICAARWTPAEARTDQDVAYDMYTNLEPKLRRSKTPRVLIVMHNRFVAAGLALMLQQFGCSVVLCSDGAKAYAKHLKREADTFNMCICDWESNGTSGISGRDLCFYEKENKGTLPFVTIAPLFKPFTDYIRQGADLVLRHPIAVHILQLREILLPNTNQFIFPAQLLGTPSNHSHLSRLLMSMERGRDIEVEMLLQQALSQLSNDAELSDHNKGVKMLDQLVESMRRRGMLAGNPFGGKVTTASDGSGGGTVELTDSEFRNMVGAFRAMLVTFGIMKDDLLNKSDELRLMREYRRKKELGNAYTAAVNAATEAVAKQQLQPNFDASSSERKSPNTAARSDSLAFPPTGPGGSLRGGGPAFVGIGQTVQSAAAATTGSSSTQQQVTSSSAIAKDLALPPLPPLTAESLSRMYEPGAFNPYAFIDTDSLTKRDINVLIRKFRNRIAELEAENELTVRELERFAFFKVELEDNLTSNNIAVRFEEVNLIAGGGADGGFYGRKSMFGGPGAASRGRSFKSANPLFTRTNSNASNNNYVTSDADSPQLLASGPYASLQQSVAALAGGSPPRDANLSPARRASAAGGTTSSMSNRSMKAKAGGKDEGLLSTDNDDDDAGDSDASDDTASPRDPFDVSPSVWEKDTAKKSKKSGGKSKKNEPPRRKSVASEGITVLKNRQPGESKADRVRSLTRKSIAGIQQMKDQQGIGSKKRGIALGDAGAAAGGTDSKPKAARTASFLLRQQHAKLTKTRSGLFSKRPNGIVENFAEYGRRLEEGRMLLEDPYAQMAIKNGDPTGTQYFKPTGLTPMVASALGISPIPLIASPVTAGPTPTSLAGINASSVAANQSVSGVFSSPSLSSKRGSLFGMNSSITSSTAPSVGLNSQVSGINFHKDRNAESSAFPPPSSAAVVVANPRTEALDKYHSNVVEFVNGIATDCNKAMAKVMAAQPSLRMTLEELSATIRDKIRNLDAVRRHKEAATVLNSRSGGPLTAFEEKLQEQLNAARNEIEKLKKVHPDAELRRKMAALRQKIFMSQQRSTRAIAQRGQIISGLILFQKWRIFALMRRMKAQEISVRATAKRELYENKGTFIGQLNFELSEKNEEIKALRNLLKQEAKIREVIDQSNRSLQGKLDNVNRTATAIQASQSANSATNQSLVHSISQSYVPRAPSKRLSEQSDMYSCGAKKKESPSEGGQSDAGTPEVPAPPPPPPPAVAAPSKGKQGSDRKGGGPASPNAAKGGKGGKAGKNGGGKKGRNANHCSNRNSNDNDKGLSSPSLSRGVSMVSEGGRSHSSTGIESVAPSTNTRDWLNQIDDDRASGATSPEAMSEAHGDHSKADANVKERSSKDETTTASTPSDAPPIVVVAAPVEDHHEEALTNNSLSMPPKGPDPLEATTAPVAAGDASEHENDAAAASAAVASSRRESKSIKSVKLNLPDGGVDGKRSSVKDSSAMLVDIESASAPTRRGTAAVVVSQTVHSKDLAAVSVPISPRLSILSTTAADQHANSLKLSSDGTFGLSPRSSTVAAEGGGAVVLGSEGEDEHTNPLGKTDPLGKQSRDPSITPADIVGIAGLPSLAAVGGGGGSVNGKPSSSLRQGSAVVPAAAAGGGDIPTSSAIAGLLANAKQMVSEGTLAKSGGISSAVVRPITPRSAQTEVLVDELKRRGFDVVPLSSKQSASGGGGGGSRLVPIGSASQNHPLNRVGIPSPPPTPTQTAADTPDQPRSAKSASRRKRVQSAPSSTRPNVRASSPTLAKGPLVPRLMKEAAEQSSSRTVAPTMPAAEEGQAGVPSAYAAEESSPTIEPAELQPIVDCGPLPLPSALLPDDLKASCLPNTADERGVQAVSVRDERAGEGVPFIATIANPKTVATQTLITFRSAPESNARDEEDRTATADPHHPAIGSLVRATGHKASVSRLPRPPSSGYRGAQGGYFAEAPPEEDVVANGDNAKANPVAEETDPRVASSNKKTKSGGAKQHASPLKSSKMTMTLSEASQHNPQKRTQRAAQHHQFKPQRLVPVLAAPHTPNTQIMASPNSQQQQQPFQYVQRRPLAEGLHLALVGGKGGVGGAVGSEGRGFPSPARGAGAQAAVVADTLRGLQSLATSNEQQPLNGEVPPSSHQHRLSISTKAAAGHLLLPLNHPSAVYANAALSLSVGGVGRSPTAALSPVVAADMTSATVKAMADIHHSIKRLQDATGAPVEINLELLERIAAQARGAEGGSVAAESSTEKRGSISEGGGNLTAAVFDQKAAYQIISEVQRTLHTAAVAAARDLQNSQLSQRQKRALERRREEERARELRYRLDEGYLLSLQQQEREERERAAANCVPDAPRRSPPNTNSPFRVTQADVPPAYVSNAFFTYTLNRPTKLQLALISHQLLPPQPSPTYAATAPQPTAVPPPVGMSSAGLSLAPRPPTEGTAGGSAGARAGSIFGIVAAPQQQQQFAATAPISLGIGVPLAGDAAGREGGEKDLPFRFGPLSPLRARSTIRRRRNFVTPMRLMPYYNGTAAVPAAADGKEAGGKQLQQGAKPNGNANDNRKPAGPRLELGNFAYTTDQRGINANVTSAAATAPPRDRSPARPQRSLYTRRRFTPPRGYGTYQGLPMLPDMHLAKHKGAQDEAARGKTWVSTTDFLPSPPPFPSSSSAGGDKPTTAGSINTFSSSSGGALSAPSDRGFMQYQPQYSTTSYNRSGNYNVHATPTLVKGVVKAHLKAAAEEEAQKQRAVPQPPPKEVPRAFISGGFGLASPRHPPANSSNSTNAAIAPSVASNQNTMSGANATAVVAPSPRRPALPNQPLQSDPMLPFTVFKDLVAKHQ